MIDYSEDCLFQTLFLLNGSVAPRACLYAVPTCLLAVIFALGDTWFWPSFREDLGILEADKSQLWVASFGVLFPVLVFRTNRAMSRFWEGTGLLHQMRGEWFDSMSCCVSFSRAGMASKPEETMIFRHTLVRLMSLCHGSALKEIGGEDAEDIETIDPFGLDTKTLQHLKDCSEVYNFNRVEVLLHMIQLVITRGLDDGIMPVPPPILSRVYQTLSRGFVNQLNAKKIADTRFPFPFSQLIALMLFVNCFTIPVMVCCLFESPVMCAIFSFLPVFGMAAMNFIGVELENPFGQDANDLPLDHFQAEMNNCLLMLLHTSADLLPASDLRRCLVDTEAIRQSAQYGQVHEKVLGNKFGNGKKKGHLYVPSKDNGEECSASRLDGTEQPHRERVSPPGAMTVADLLAQEKAKEPPRWRQEMPAAEAKPPKPAGKEQAVGKPGIDVLLQSLGKIKDTVQMQSKEVAQSTQVISDFSHHVQEVMESMRSTKREVLITQQPRTHPPKPSSGFG